LLFNLVVMSSGIKGAVKGGRSQGRVIPSGEKVRKWGGGGIDVHIPESYMLLIERYNSRHLVLLGKGEKRFPG